MIAYLPSILGVIFFGKQAQTAAQKVRFILTFCSMSDGLSSPKARWSKAAVMVESQ
jgi:hypothetical protein